MTDASGGGRLPDPDQLILEAATGVRRLSEAELRYVLEHVAQAGFDPNARERVRGRLAGFIWQGRVLRGRDMLPSAELKYAWHALHREEWPIGTALDGYIAGIRDSILDERSGIFTSRFNGLWQLGVVCRSGALRGPRGHEWLIVEYRLATRHWTTAYQLEQGLRGLRAAERSDMRWLRRPRRLRMQSSISTVPGE